MRQLAQVLEHFPLDALDVRLCIVVVHVPVRGHMKPAESIYPCHLEHSALSESSRQKARTCKPLETKKHCVLFERQSTCKDAAHTRIHVITAGSKAVVKVQ